MNESNTFFDKFLGFLNRNAMFVILLITMVLFEILLFIKGRGSLFSPMNLTNLIAQNGYVVILATGMLLCILTGGNIDLSVGGIVILVGAYAGILIVNWEIDIYNAIVICLVIGGLIGAWQAFWIAYMKIPPFIVTLAGMLSFRGLALMMMGSQNIGPFPAEFKALFNNFIPASWVGDDRAAIMQVSLMTAGLICLVLVILEVFTRIRKQRKGYTVSSLPWAVLKVATISGVLMFIFWKLGQHNGIPVLLILLGVIIIFYDYFTQNTVFGRYLYAMGGNEKAARLSGINTKRMLFFAYTNMGVLASVAALVCVARFNQASTQAGTGYEMDAIGACYIGGASAYGGVGKVGGAVIGAIFMGVLNMGMSLLGWDQNLQKVIKGLVLLAAIVFDVLSKNRELSA